MRLERLGRVAIGLALVGVVFVGAGWSSLGDYVLLAAMILVSFELVDWVSRRRGGRGWP
jgi:hypothetical protein